MSDWELGEGRQTERLALGGREDAHETRQATVEATVCPGFELHAEGREPPAQMLDEEAALSAAAYVTCTVSEAVLDGVELSGNQDLEELGLERQVVDPVVRTG